LAHSANVIILVSVFVGHKIFWRGCFALPRLLRPGATPPPNAPGHATDSPHCCYVAPRVGIASRYDVMQCARASFSYVAYCVLKQLLRCIVLSLYAPERQIVDIFTHQTFSAIDYLRKHTYDIGCFNRAP